MKKEKKGTDWGVLLAILGWAAFIPVFIVIGFIWHIIKFAIFPFEALALLIDPFFDDKVKAWAKNSKFKKLVDFYYDYFREKN